MVVTKSEEGRVVKIESRAAYLHFAFFVPVLLRLHTSIMKVGASKVAIPTEINSLVSIGSGLPATEREGLSGS